ncbi:hypothetical protein [Amycolatopsis sp. MtRt-6]|uniref:hypothetical protein n=1 Tax=Amycolatopsis sp. MtRt-6 TaxID=2792782 RepID=UPI001A8C204A
MIGGLGVQLGDSPFDRVTLGGFGYPLGEAMGFVFVEQVKFGGALSADGDQLRARRIARPRSPDHLTAPENLTAASRANSRKSGHLLLLHPTPPVKLCGPGAPGTGGTVLP